MKKFIIITTINEKSQAIKKFEQLEDWNIILVGDKKSQRIESNEKITFLSVEDQNKLDFKIVDNCPYNHYARKNIGYLYALSEGADIIYDTDDDNLPYDDWKMEDLICNINIQTQGKYLNIYRYFTNVRVWPRGFPLDEIWSKYDFRINESKPKKIAVWQGLADIQPDVDAIYRLTQNQQIQFEKKPSVYLEKSVYCPFNSQNTFWRKEFFPLLYLPTTTSFRFTDILRGYIAQRLMWEEDFHLGFTKATVYQNRNVHDLMNDFEQEIECYMNVKKVVYILDTIELDGSMIENLFKIYSELFKNGIVKKEEIDILKLWINDFEENYVTHNY